ncbi:2,3-bisphosphoglycerate-independent phosphoglycerate mutase [Thermoleophilia bacterium SCSIO 60948]|nr:2,3-bisphosphoglycerate-independent phosphoglycerate mutase [Thermoleophilia bacterium SCSIO 60948]
MSIPAGPSELPVDSVCLVILDGWGIAPDGEGNAVSQAATPVFDELISAYPDSRLNTSGTDVGLPEGQMGNSEVGHLNLGAGAIVDQDLKRIDDAIADGSFYEIDALKEACAHARDNGGRIHLLGLLSDGGVHSGWTHIEAVIELAAQEGVEAVLHAFTDGRDVSPTAAPGYISEAERWLRQAGKIGTVGGRYYAMDRDKRWERTKLAYDAIVHAEGQNADSAEAAVEAARERDETDEFIKPTVIGDYDGFRDGDAAIHFNFRPDRGRQLAQALGDPDFDEFPRGDPPDVPLTTMTEFSSEFDFPVAFPPHSPETTLAEVISEDGGEQLHVAETEKYAHVTYFFNGGREKEWEGEERFLAESPRDVATYDEKPEMNAQGATDALVEHFSSDTRFAVINFANPDMVGHTGSIPAAIEAVETVDRCLGEVVTAVHGAGGACLITADHGNCEQMLTESGDPHTAHSTNPVPLILTVEGAELREGILADVAPTVLALLGIDQPEAMTGKSLISSD